MLRKPFNHEPVNLVLSTEHLSVPEQQSLGKIGGDYDETFLSRYRDDKNSDRLNGGEAFYDQDKYSIFYLHMPGKKVDAFVKEVTGSIASCLFIGEIDKDYNLKPSGKPFYIDEDRTYNDRGKFALSYVNRRDKLSPLCTPKKSEISF